MAESVRRRRHGAELETAILSAGWDELVEVGIVRLTMGSVAARAGTSEAVLYRRWANKDQLVLAAIKQHRQTHPIEAPDTGSLRTDLIAELTAVSQALAGFYAIAAAAVFSGVLSDSGLTFAQARNEILGSPQRIPQRASYRRAHERGELDVEQVPTTVLEMPFDLVRHDLLMDREAPSSRRIRAIVDELFLPLVNR